MDCDDGVVAMDNIDIENLLDDLDNLNEYDGDSSLEDEPDIEAENIEQFKHMENHSE